MPWNFPLWQVIRFAAPALMVGNVGLLKHASNVPQTALALEDLFRRAGLPEGVFTNLFVESKDVAGHRDPRVAAVTLTGSERRRHVGGRGRRARTEEERARARRVRPLHRASSADLDAACALRSTARVQNNGQSCIAAKRFIVVDEVYDEFLARFTEAMDALVVGDPFDPATDVGPIVTEAQRNELVGQVEEAVRQGATAHAARRCPTATAGTSPRPCSRASPWTWRWRRKRSSARWPWSSGARPRRARSTWPTRTPSGSARASGRTTRPRRRRCIEGIEAGAVFVNAMVASTPELPFGGIKRSGFGRELSRARAQGVRQRQDRLHRLSAVAVSASPAAVPSPISTTRPRRRCGPRWRPPWPTCTPGHGPLGNPTGATRRPSGPAGCSKRPATKWPSSWAAIRPTIVFTSGGTEAANLAVLGRPRPRSTSAGEAVVLASAVEHPAVRESARAAVRAGAERARAAGRPRRCARSRRARPCAVVAGDRWWRSWPPTTRRAWSSRSPRWSSRAPARARRRSSSPTPCRPRRGSTWPRSPAEADLVSLSAAQVRGPVASAPSRSAPACALEPRQHGGGQERERRSGTQDVAGAVGLAAALALVAAERAWPRRRVAAQRDRLAEGSSPRSLARVRTCPPRAPPSCPGHLTCASTAWSARSCSSRSAAEGVCVSGGSSCASGALEPSHVLAAMGVDAGLAAGRVRFTPGRRDTTDADVDRALRVVPGGGRGVRRRV